MDLGLISLCVLVFDSVDLFLNLWLCHFVFSHLDSVILPTHQWLHHPLSTHLNSPTLSAYHCYCCFPLTAARRLLSLHRGLLIRWCCCTLWRSPTHPVQSIQSIHRPFPFITLLAIFLINPLNLPVVSGPLWVQLIRTSTNRPCNIIIEFRKLQTNVNTLHSTLLSFSHSTLLFSLAAHSSCTWVLVKKIINVGDEPDFVAAFSKKCDNFAVFLDVLFFF